MAFRRPDGRVVVSRQPCDWKGCPACGPRLRQRLADQWAEAMGCDEVFRAVVTDAELPRLRRRKVVAQHLIAHIPLPNGMRAVYSGARIGERVTDKIGTLTSDFAAMPNDSRRRFLHPDWAAVVADAKAEAKAKREVWEWLGRVGQALEQVDAVARDMGAFVGRTDDMVVIEVMELQDLVWFLRRIDCRGPWEQWMNPRAKAA